MDYASLIEKKRLRIPELEELMATDGFFNDQDLAAETNKEYNRTKNLIDDWDLLEKTRVDLVDNQEIARSDDKEMAEMAADEIPQLENRIARLELAVQYSLLPHDPNEDRDAMVEIRAGTGGDEAALFAGELLRMYQRHAEEKGWKIENIDFNATEIGGFSKAIFKVSGDEVFRYLKYESGVHRVQRVPQTETQGRIHTSAATVAVMPEADEVDVVLRPDDLHIQFTRSGGPGGQHVNTTDSAAQITHLPTGIMVKCQDGRSQTKNKEKALQILRSKLLEAKIQKEAEQYSSQRKLLIGSGGREEKIRTYNFPQNRVTDHRVNLTLHNLDQVMDGKINELTEHLQTAEMEDRLSELESDA